MSIFSKRLCLLHGIAMLFLLVFSSCEKDQFVPTDTTTLAFQSSSHEDLQAASSLVTLPSSLRVQLSSYVRKNVTEEKNAKMTLDSLLEAILAQPARVFVDSNQVRNYASYVPTENPLHILNLVYATEDGSLSHGYLHLFRMSPEFASDFNSFSASITDFVGEVSVYQISDLTKLAYAREEKNIDAEDCFTLVFSGPVAGPNGGGGANNNGETAGTTTGNPVGGGINWGTTPGYVGVIGGPGGTSTGPGGTSGGPGGTSGTTVSTGPNGGSTQDCGPDADNATVIETYESGGSTFEVIRYQICNGGGIATTIREKQDQLISIESTNKNDLDSEDCIRLLSTVGIVPRRLVTPEMSELTHEQIEAAILETCFVPAVALSVIDPDAFELCYNSGVQGSTCVKNQVTGFLNDLFPDPINIPNSPLSFTISFDDVSHDHQSIFLNAAVAADGNEHTLAGIAFSRINLSEPIISNDLSDQILYLSLLHKELDDPSEFVNSATAYLDIIKHLNDDASNAILTSLVTHPEALPTVSSFLEEVGYDEVSKRTVLLITDEFRNNIDYDEVGTEARHNVILDNAPYYANALEETTDIECCSGLQGTGFSSTEAQLRYISWHADRFEEEVALLKYVYPEKYPLNSRYNRMKLKMHAEWRVMSGTLHLTLDLLGLIPGVGAAPDLVNGVFYAIEGDGLNATMSFGAAVPVVGLLAGGEKLIKWIKFGTRTRRLAWVRRSDGIIFFLPIKPKSWRDFWDFPEGTVGHHMIPKAKFDHPLLQKAVNVTEEGVQGFHPHSRANGYPLDPARHIGAHNPYTNKVVAEMTRWNQAFPNATPEQAASAIRAWQDDIRELITLTTGSIDDLTIPFIRPL